MEYILPFIDINSRRTSPKMASKQLNDLSIVRATPKLNTRVVALSTPIPSRCLTFRLSGIPLDMDADALCWGLDSLLVGEFSIKGNSKVFSLAAYSSWQVATVTFHDVPDEFSDCKPGHEKHVQLPKRVVTVHQGPVSINRNNPDHRVTSQFLARQADTGAMLVSVTVDCDFYGMTRLYQPAQVTAEYDIFAVTGLSAHAFGSWKAPEQAETMWLRDFLPLEFPNMRVHTWGYRSSIEDNRSKTSITDISRTFLEDVKRMRENQ
ncbi:hypothetical protein BZA77DRAFT_149381 [Pyronema omphalodes]|nr:hypothetical protein BZA77DRAFT_149381 [Pyronema omphalodes]